MTAGPVRGDDTGLVIPADLTALRDAGPAFLTEAFRVYGVLSAGNRVTDIDHLEEVSGGSTGRKAALTVRYADTEPGLPTDLFVKFSRDFDDAARDVGRTQMQAEVRFAVLARAPGFPIEVPVTLFADYHGASGTGLLITERIPFGVNGIEAQHHKCLDYELPEPVEHYRALLAAAARLAGTQRSGRLPADLVDMFPVDLQAATVGERRALTGDQVARRLARLVDFVDAHPDLFPARVRAAEFLSRFPREATDLLAAEPAIWQYLEAASDYIALCHWNANVDNAWFRRDTAGVLHCGLLDWGCVSRLNLAMVLWGALSGAETDLWDHHLDDLLDVFCDEVAAAGGPRLDRAVLTLQLVLYATLMGVTWLLDVPALVRARIPEAGPHLARTDPAIRDDEGVRAPLQMLTNVLNIWASHNVPGAVRAIGGSRA